MLYQYSSIDRYSPQKTPNLKLAYNKFDKPVPKEDVVSKQTSEMPCG